MTPDPVTPPKAGLLPNRVVAIATAVLTLILALVPVVADLDLASTAGIIAGVGAIAAVALKWLTGWQQAEKADLEARLTTHRANVELSLAEAAAAKAEQVGGPRKSPKPYVPHR